MLEQELLKDTPEKEGELSKELKDSLHALIRSLEVDDETSRLDILSTVQRHDLFWHGHQDLYYDNDRRTWGTILDAYKEGYISSQDLEDYDKTVNTYRAHGESIIAASTIEIPKVRYFPEDSNDPLDIMKSKAYTKIADLIQIQNEIKEKLRRAYFILYNQHFAAAYIYAHESEEYGTIAKPVFKTEPYQEEGEACAACGQEISPGYSEPYCESCNQVTETIPTYVEKEKEVLDHIEITPKRRVCIEVYGPKNVKFPSWVSDLKHSPYLTLESEQHYLLMRRMYPEYAKDIIPGVYGGIGDYRKNSTKSGLVLHKRTWLPPWAYGGLEDEGKEAEMYLKYPNGAVVTSVGEVVVGCKPSSMEEHWEITRSVFDDQLHADPIGKPYIPIAEMINEMTRLAIETIRQGIGETFADPEVLDFPTYSMSEATPGAVYPAVPKPGQNLSGAFYETSHSTLSKDFPLVLQKLEQFGEFTLGDFPSVFGGRMVQGSQTFGEYETSRQSALQRLGLNSDMVALWYANVMAKATKLFEETMLEGEDESYSVQMGKSWETIVIKKEEMEGKIGRIVPETSPFFPVTWSQTRDTFMNMLDKKIPEFNAAAFHPENTGFTKDIIGMRNFFVPGELDREKQLWEINGLLKSQAMSTVDPMTGMPIEQSSIPIEDTDDDAVHIQTINAWANSDNGIMMRGTPGFTNVLAHRKEHEMRMQMAQMQAQVPVPQETPQEQPKEGMEEL